MTKAIYSGDVDHLRFLVPMSYLYAGTEVLLMRGFEKFRAVTDMDGHYVSPNYGAMYEPDRAKYFHDNPDANYINIRIPSLQGETRVRPGDNLTIYERDEWLIYASNETHKKFQRDVGKQERLENRKRLALVAEAERDLKNAQRALELAQQKLSDLR